MGNPNHDPKNGEFTNAPGGGDMAVVNVPLSKRGGGDLNSQIDKWKKDQAVAARLERAHNAQIKQQARSLFAEHRAEIIDKYGPKMGPKLESTLKSMATWEPQKFIGLVEKFKSGK